MRVLFLTLYPEAAASPRYRVHQFLPYLRKEGIECMVAAPLSEAAWRRHTGPNRRGRALWYHLHETPHRIVELLQAHAYDVVFLQKALMSAYLRGLPTLLRHQAQRLIYDIDDAVHLAPPHALRFPWTLFEDRQQVQRIMAMADTVLAGNTWLVEQTQQYGGVAKYFPTVVDTERFIPPQNIPASFRIGWIGAPSTTSALAVAAPALMEQKNAEIVLVGADPKKVHLACATVQPWSHDTEVSDVQQFSVGILPQHKDTWTRGKCALKALQYMACGVPCIATPYGAICDIIQEGKNGLFADSDAQWRQALDRMRDPAERQRLGEAARATVESRFSLQKAAPQLVQLLRKGEL